MDRWRTLERRLWLVTLAASLVLGVASPAAGTHSASGYLNAPWYWDKDINGAADDPEPLKFGGGDWGPSKKDRVREAAAAWRNATDFDPTVATTHENLVHIDGRVPPSSCPGGGFTTWPVGYLALACVTNYLGASGCNCRRITDADFYFTNHPNYQWRYSSGAYSSPGASDYDFRGVLTHEIGHSIKLRDLFPEDEACGSTTDSFTMCGPISGYGDSFNRRGLETDDINAANSLYPSFP